jgi:excisionase family DNA binding protein
MENQSIPSRRLLTVKAAAQYLGCGVYGVRELLWRRELPVVRWGKGGKYWIDLRDLDALIERSKGTL